MATAKKKITVAQSNLRSELVQEIGAAAREMFRHKPTGETPLAANLSGLQQLQQWCDHVIPLASDRTDCFLLFFLSSFIRDMFFNLTGDLPYDEETEKNKQAFFKLLFKRLKELASSVSSGKRNDWIVACEALLESYLLTINTLNDTN